MIRQLAFDLPTQADYRRDSFFLSPANAVAFASVEGWRDWPGGKMLLVGPSGAGKTHLAHIWAEESNAAFVAANDLSALDLPALCAQGAVVIEDAEDVAGQPQAEEALFHLHNLLLPQGRLLLTAASPARDWGLALPDLKSRIEATPIARLDGPDDALLSAVLVKLFADRQVTVPPSLIPWLVSRMERSICAARELVAALDQQALAQGKPISRGMAAALLDREDAE